MYCSQCGKQTGENDKFCPNCGAPVVPAIPAAPAVPPVTEVTPLPPQEAQPVLPENQGINMREVTPEDYQQTQQPQEFVAPPQMATPQQISDAIKKIFRSPLLLIAAIALTAGLACYFAYIIDNIEILSINIKSILSSATDGYREEIGIISEYAYLFYIALQLPAVLIALGMWITCISSHRKKEGLTAGGIKLIKGVLIFQLVLYILAALLCILLLALGMATAGLVGQMDVIFGFLLLAAFIVLLLVYQIKLLSTADVMRRTVQYRVPVHTVSVLAAVINFLFAAFEIYQAYLSFVSSGILLALNAIFAALTYIFLGAFILYYRRAAFILYYHNAMRNIR